MDHMLPLVSENSLASAIIPTANPTIACQSVAVARTSVRETPDNAAQIAPVSAIYGNLQARPLTRISSPDRTGFGIPNTIAIIHRDLAEQGARLVEAIVQAGLEPHLTALGGFGESGA